MLKYFSTFLLFLFCSIVAFAQHNIHTSKEIRITGELDADKLVTLEDLKSFSAESIPDLMITNHMGEPRGELKNMKGISVLKILEDLKISVDSPKYLSEIYFTFVATDDYKVVFSWNELFNSPTGAHTFLVTEANGVKLEKMEDRILMICTTDFKTGRRHVKSLDRIIVNRVN